MCHVATVHSVHPARLACLFMAVTSLSLVFHFTKDRASTNPASRFATIESLVHRRTFVIDEASFDSIDKVRIDGHFYSSKPPLLSVIGAGAYALLHGLGGLDLRHPESRSAAVFWLTFLLMGAAHVALLYFTYRILEDFAPHDDARLWAFATVALALLPLGYATTLNNHTPAAALLLGAFFFARRAHATGASRDFLLVGALGGLAPAMDLGAIFVSSAFGLWLLVTHPRGTLRLLVPVALVPVALHFGLTYMASGGVSPVYLRDELYHYEGSYWNAPKGVDALAEPKWIYLLNMLVGHHGLFALTPLLLLAIIALTRVARDKTHPHRREAFVVGGSLLTLLAFYALTTNNYGGRCVGFRWLIVIMPLCALFVAHFVSEVARGRKTWLFVLGLAFALSQYGALNALRAPWSRSDWHEALSRVGLAPSAPK